MNEKQLYNFTYDIYKTKSNYTVVEASNTNIGMTIFLRSDNGSATEAFIVANDSLKIKKYYLPFGKKAYKKYCNVYDQMKVLLSLAGNAAKMKPSEKYILMFGSGYGNPIAGGYSHSGSSWYGNIPSSYSFQSSRHSALYDYDDLEMKSLFRDMISRISKETLTLSPLNILEQQYDRFFFPGWYNHIADNKSLKQDYTILPRIKYDIKTKKIEFTFKESSEDDEQDGDLNDSNYGKHYFGNKAYCWI